MNTSSKVLLTLILILFSIQSVTAQSSYSNYDLELLTFVASGQSSSTSLQEVSTAQNALAIRYYNGTGGARKDHTTAFKWFLKSAESGNEYGMYNVANRYANGEGTSVNMPEAAYWMERAAMYYMHDAAANAAYWYLYGIGGLTVDYAKAAKYAKIAVFTSMEDGFSRYLYAMCYAYGYGVSQNSDKAIYWANKALELDILDSYYLLGVMYRDGVSVPQKPYKAQDYFLEGIWAGNATCMKALGDLYYYGVEGFDTHVPFALDYWEQAANKGHLGAMQELADTYGWGEEQYQNYPKAIYWYEKLIENGQGNIDNVEALAIMYEEEEMYDKAAKTYKKLYSLGDISAYNDLSLLYASGKLGAPDFNMALSLINSIIKADPNDYDFLDTKGEILLMKGDVKGARKIWETINKKRPLYYTNFIKEYDHTTTLDEYMKNNPK